MSDFDADLFGDAIKTDEPKKRGAVSEVAPGQYVSHTLNAWEVPQYVLSKLVPDGTGSYRLEVVDEWAGWIRLQDIRRTLGIAISHHTVRRLCIAGFVEHCHPSPQIYLIKIDSLLEHLKRTCHDLAKEKTYWTDKRRELWRTSCGL